MFVDCMAAFDICIMRLGTLAAELYACAVVYGTRAVGLGICANTLQSSLNLCAASSTSARWF